MGDAEVSFRAEMDCRGEGTWNWEKREIRNLVFTPEFLIKELKPTLKGLIGRCFI